ncbi:unnamed protein product [Cochlearia groenlandica]
MDIFSSWFNRSDPWREVEYGTGFNGFRFGFGFSVNRALRSFFSTSSSNNSSNVSKLRFLIRSNTLLLQIRRRLPPPPPPQISNHFLIRVLDMIREKPEIAYHFFKWLQNQRDVKQSLRAFATVLEILAENDLMNKAYWVAERSIDLGMHEICEVLIDECIDQKIACKVMNLLLWVYTKKSMVEQCLFSFEKMIRKGSLPSVRNC